MAIVKLTTVYNYCIIDVSIMSAAAANIVTLSLIIDAAQKSIESRKKKSKQDEKKSQL